MVGTYLVVLVLKKKMAAKEKINVNIKHKKRLEDLKENDRETMDDIIGKLIREHDGKEIGVNNDE